VRPDDGDRRILHVPALDGLRGVAVLAVVAFHADGLLRGGYLGVDLFFVLSGYLITSILLREHDETGSIGLRAFWKRRARRLLPALLLLMPAVAIYTLTTADPSEVATIRGDMLATLGYVANWRAIFAHKSYWAMFASPSPLEHTWSLAIEEQFYVVWPLLLAGALARGAGRRTLAMVSSGLALASVVMMLALYTEEHASRVYLGSDTRAAAILVGATLATFLLPSATFSARSVRALDIAGLASMALLGAAWATLEGERPLLYRGGFWVTEIAALVLITCAVASARHRSIVGRLLSFRPLVFVGTISYGVYLWHWPVDVVITTERLHASMFVTNLVRVGVTLAIASASYRWIEGPIRRRGISRRWAIVMVPTSLLVTSLLLIIATKTRQASPVRPAPIPFPPLLPATTAAGRWPDFTSVKSNVLPTADELPPRTLRVLVIGDSVAQFLGEALRYQQASAHAFVAQRGVGGCSIHEDGFHDIDGQRIEGPSCAQSWVTDVTELRPDVTFIVLGGAFLGPSTCQQGWRKAYHMRLTFLLHAIGTNAGRIIVALVPYPMGERRQRWNMLPSVDCFNDELTMIAKAEEIPTIDLMSHVCPTKECNVMSEGAPIRIDGLHFDGQGAAETARWALSEINRIVRPGDTGGAY
jgi:peptidoglycan/LPS O-acetylase OafA/YrhL/lysophospholipase L1-like esterase